MDVNDYMKNTNFYHCRITEELLNYDIEDAESISQIVTREVKGKDLEGDIHMEDILSQSGKRLCVKVNDIREQMKNSFELVEFSGLLNTYEKTLDEIKVIAQAYDRCSSINRVQSKVR